MKINSLIPVHCVCFCFIYEEKLTHFNKRALKLLLMKGKGKEHGGGGWGVS